MSQGRLGRNQSRGADRHAVVSQAARTRETADTAYTRASRKLIFESLEDRRVFANTAPEELGIVAREFAADAVAPADFSFDDPAGEFQACVLRRTLLSERKKTRSASP